MNYTDKNTASMQFNLFAMAIISLVTLTVFGQVIGFELINYDDPYFITLNEHVMSGLTTENIQWSFSSREMGIWHPLTWMSYQLEVSIFGQNNPAAHHSVNLALHLFNSLLVYLLCMRLTGARWASLFVALLFSIHPQHVQPVAWVSERKELLSAFFFLVSLYLYAGYRLSGEKIRGYLLSLIMFCLALLCKPSVAPLPLLLMLIDVFFVPSNNNHLCIAKPVAYGLKKTVERQALFKNIIHKTPFLIASIGASMVAIYLKKTGHWVEVEEVWHLGLRLLLMPISLLHYLQALVLPWPNQFWIEPPVGELYLQSAFSIVLLSLIGYFIWRLRNRAPELVFGALWFVIMWLPISGIVLVSNYFVADRYTYLPYIGCFIGLVFLLCSFANSNSVQARLLGVVGAIIIAGFAALAYRQTSYWHDSATLFKRELEIHPQSSSAPLYIGHALLSEKKYTAALDYFQRAIKRKPDSAFAYAYLGDTLRALNKKQASIEAYRKALEYGTDRARLYGFIGQNLANNGSFNAAIKVFKQGLERQPLDLTLLNYTAYVYGFNLNQPNLALSYYQQVLELAPDNTHALHSAGVLYIQFGQTDKGVQMLKNLLLIDAGNDTARSALEHALKRR